MASAMRARFPKLLAALGDEMFETMLAAYVARDPLRAHARDAGAQLADFLGASVHYPAWYGELALLDRAHLDVMHAPAARRFDRLELSLESELRLVPAATLVELTTSVDELWQSLDRGAPVAQPCHLDWPRTVVVWRSEGLAVHDRTASPSEASALRAARRGTSILELAAGFGGDNPSAHVLDMVLGWIDDGLLAKT